MKFLAFSIHLDRVALGMTLAAGKAAIIKEPTHGVWLINSETEDAKALFTRLFGLPALEPGDDCYRNGVSVVLVGLNNRFGFVDADFLKSVRA